MGGRKFLVIIALSIMLGLASMTLSLSLLVPSPEIATQFRTVTASITPSNRVTEVTEVLNIHQTVEANCVFPITAWRNGITVGKLESYKVGDKMYLKEDMAGILNQEDVDISVSLLQQLIVTALNQANGAQIQGIQHFVNQGKDWLVRNPWFDRTPASERELAQEIVNALSDFNDGKSGVGLCTYKLDELIRLTQLVVDTLTPTETMTPTQTFTSTIFYYSRTPTPTNIPPQDDKKPKPKPSARPTATKRPPPPPTEPPPPPPPPTEEPLPTLVPTSG